jgi:hypothetical protein
VQICPPCVHIPFQVEPSWQADDRWTRSLSGGMPEVIAIWAFVTEGAGGHSEGRMSAAETDVRRFSNYIGRQACPDASSASPQPLKKHRLWAVSSSGSPAATADTRGAASMANGRTHRHDSPHLEGAIPPPTDRACRKVVMIRRQADPTRHARSVKRAVLTLGPAPTTSCSSLGDTMLVCSRMIRIPRSQLHHGEALDACRS